MKGTRMPTTLSSLLIFVVLLLPGFAYLVGKERHGTERHTSPFRETVAIVAASVTSELTVLGLFAARAVLPNPPILLRCQKGFFCKFVQPLPAMGRSPRTTFSPRKLRYQV